MPCRWTVLSDPPSHSARHTQKHYEDSGHRNHSYGLLHIEAGHGDEIRRAGFGSVEEFVEAVARNYTDIREGGVIAGKQTYLLEVSDEHNNTLFIQLSRDGSYWNVNSAGIFRKTYSRRRPKVHTVPAVGGGTVTDTPDVNSGHSKGATAPAGNSLQTSGGKGNASLGEKQGAAEKGSAAEVEDKAAEKAMGAGGKRPGRVARALGRAVTRLLRGKGVRVVTDAKEFRRVYQEMEDSHGVQRQAYVKDVSRRFDEELQQQIDGNLSSGHVYRLGTPGAILLSTGMPNLPIELSAQRLLDKATNFGHDFDLPEVKGLVDAIQHPVAVFAYGDKSKSQNIVLEISHNGKNFIVGISLAPTVKGQKLEINSIRNVFPKDNTEWVKWIQDGKLLYVDKNKIQPIIDQLQTNPADVARIKLDLVDVAKVIKDFENPKITVPIIEQMTVWHGSPHTFAGFDFSRMGSGEGAQAHGWGGYVTLGKETGMGYAKVLGRDYGVRYIGSETDMYKRDALRDMAMTMERGGLSFEEAKERCLRLYGNRFEPTHKRKHQAIEESRKEDFEASRNLYEVEIPDDTGKNYLYEEKEYSPEEIREIANGLREAYRSEPGEVQRTLGAVEERLNGMGYTSGRDLYRVLSDVLGSDRRASEALSELGYVGIRYDGRQDGPCAVIFKEGDMRIKNRTEFLRTRSGEVYGFVKDGVIYLDPEVMNANTPIHEYTHLWDKALMAANPELWARGKELMKELPLWQQVKEDPNYAEIAGDEDLLASEVHSRLAGESGERSLDAMVEAARKEGPLAVAEKVALKERVKAWLKDAFAWVRDAFAGNWGKGDLAKLTVEEFAAMPLKDLAGEGRRVSEDSGIRFRTSEELDKEYPTWLSGQTTESGQHTTQITSTKATYKKIGEHLIGEGVEPGDVSVLDASSGLGVGTQALRDMGFDVEDVEPYPSEKRDAPTYSRYEDIEKKYDVVISNAVLNVIPDDWRSDVLKSMADRLKVGGRLFINVRDAAGVAAQKQKIELDSPSEILVTDKQGNIRAYQKGFTKKELLDYVRKELGDGFDVEIANAKNSGIGNGTAVVVTRKSDEPLRYRAIDASHQGAGGRYTRRTIERGFGGLWIADKQEFAKFASATVNNRFEHDGEGVCYTDNHFYAYYRNIDGEAIPFIDIYLNTDQSQDLVAYVEKERAGGKDIASACDRYINRSGAERLSDTDNRRNITDSEGVSDAGTRRLVSGAIRRGRYANVPRNYVKGVEPLRSRDYRDGGVTAEADGRRSVGEVSRREMAARAESLGRELGVEVEVVHDATAIEHEDARMQRRMRRSKGWYDPETGRIVVVVGNHSSAADVEATVLHEIVGHKGLRGVVGEERFNRFLEKVYFGASEQVRSRINELARENGWGLREATEEYMAQMAERGFRDRLERGFWGRVKNFFGDMMSAARIGLGFRVNDRDLRWMLWRSYKLQRGEGRGVMGRAEDTMMQRKLGVGDYGAGVRFRDMFTPQERMAAA